MSRHQEKKIISTISDEENNMDKRYKVLMLNGSPVENGNITVAFREMERIFEEANVEYETIQIGRMDIRGCIACGSCGITEKCVFNDIVNEIAVKFEKADGLVVQYWNNIYGGAPGEASADEEGRQVMRVLARNMVFLMKSIELGKEQLGLPETEDHAWTNFIR